MLKHPQCVLKDLAKIGRIIGKLHSVETFLLDVPHVQQQREKQVKYHIDHYTSEQMTVNELELLVDKIQNDGLILVPAQLNFSYGLGFRVLWPHDCEQKYVEELFSFKESQLPEGHDFGSLSKVFLSPENIILCHTYGITVPENDRRVYE